MTPLRVIALWLSFALPLAAAPLAPTAEDAAKVVAKVVFAFESGSPVDAAVSPADLLVLETAPITARSQAAFYRKLPETIKRVGAFQKVRTPAVPVCSGIPAPDKDPNGCVMAAARAAAKDLGIAEAPRQESAAALYLAVYLGPKNGSPAELSAAQTRAAAAMSDPRLSQQSAARMRRVMAQGGLFTTPGDPGAVGTGGSAAPAGSGPGYRGVNAAIAEARSRSRAQSIPVNAREVPSLSERLSASAREDETLLKHGQDDGTWGTAVGRGVTQIKKGGSELLSYFTSGDTWRRTGRGAVEMVSNPGETVRYLPGALKEAGVALWNGVKADIRTASDEVGNFIEKPTPYNGMKVVGSVGLAVSNAFVVGGGGKAAVRQGARKEIAQGARQAEKLADNLIGAADDLDFTTLAAPKGSAYQVETRSVRAAIKNDTYVAPAELKGRIGVNQTVFDDVEAIGRQRGSDCARFGITSCSIANGTPMTKARVEDAAASVMRQDAEATVARLEDKMRRLKAEGGSTEAASKALIEARSKLIMADVGLSAEYGLDFSAIGSTLRELKLPHRSLGTNSDALAALRRGEVTQPVLDYRRAIDTELVRGNAVMAALYTGADGAHAQHAVTILGRGKDSAGRIVYEIYDSNVGRVAQIPVDAVRPFGAVVVGRL
jgi:hypothetical protein